MFSASGATRAVMCPASLALPKLDKVAGEAADYGTAMHELFSCGPETTLDDCREFPRFTEQLQQEAWTHSFVEELRGETCAGREAAPETPLQRAPRPRSG